MCSHQPFCPDANAPDREAARVIVSHPEQGWSLLCNGVVLFSDTGELLPDGRIVEPARPEPSHRDCGNLGRLSTAHLVPLPRSPLSLPTTNKL